MPKLELNGFDDLERAIEELPDLALDAGVPAMTDAMLFLHGKIPEYPPSSMESFAPDGWSFVSDSQRAFFFASVKAGKIKGWKWVEEEIMGLRGKPIKVGHPEKTGSARTGTLGRKITEEVERVELSVVGTQGTNTPYAPWVVGPSFPGETINGRTMYQARVHEGRWWQLYDVFDENVDGAWQAFDERFFPELQERWANA